MLFFVSAIICTKNFYIRQYQTEKYFVRKQSDLLTLSLGEFKESELYYEETIPSSILKFIHTLVDPKMVLDIAGGKSLLLLFEKHGGPNQRFMLDPAEDTANVYRVKYGINCLEYDIDKNWINSRKCVDASSDKYKFQLFEFVYEEDLNKNLLNESNNRVGYLQSIIEKQNKMLEGIKSAQNIQTGIDEEINKFAPNNESNKDMNCCPEKCNKANLCEGYCKKKEQSFKDILNKYKNKLKSAIK